MKRVFTFLIAISFIVSLGTIISAENTYANNSERVELIPVSANNYKIIMPIIVGQLEFNAFYSDSNGDVHLGQSDEVQIIVDANTPIGEKDMVILSQSYLSHIIEVSAFDTINNKVTFREITIDQSVQVTTFSGAGTLYLDGFGYSFVADYTNKSVNFTGTGVGKCSSGSGSCLYTPKEAEVEISAGKNLIGNSLKDGNFTFRENHAGHEDDHWDVDTITTLVSDTDTSSSNRITLSTPTSTDRNFSLFSWDSKPNYYSAYTSWGIFAEYETPLNGQNILTLNYPIIEDRADVYLTSGITTIIGNNCTIDEYCNQLEGDAFNIEKSSDRLNLWQQINSIFETATQSDLYHLGAGTVTNNKGTYVYKQYIIAPSYAQVIYSVNSVTSDPELLLKFPSGSVPYDYRLSFPTSIKSDIDGNKNFKDLNGNKIKVLGKEFTIIDTDNTTGMINMMGGAVEDTLEEGQTKTYTINGVDYEVTVNAITDTAPFKSKFTINGEVTEALEAGQTYELKDGTELGVREILPNEAGDITADIVSIYLGDDNVIFMDSNYSAGNLNGKLEVNGETIPDVNVDIVASLNGNTISISRIDVKFTSSEDYIISEGSKLSDQIGENKKDILFLRKIDYVFQSIDSAMMENVKLYNVSSNQYMLEMLTKAGHLDIIAFYSDVSANVHLGQSDDVQIIVDADTPIRQNDMVILSQNYYSHVIEMSSFDSINKKVRFTDIATGDSTQITTSGGLGTLYLDGFGYSFVADYTNKSVKFIGAGVGECSSGSGSCLYTPNKVGVKLSAGLIRNTLTEGLFILTEYPEGHELSPGTVNNITILLSDEGISQSDKLIIHSPSSSDGNLSLTTWHSKRNYQTAYTSWGTSVNYETQPGGQNTLEINCPIEQTHADVYLTIGGVRPTCTTVRSCDPVEGDAFKIEKSSDHLNLWQQLSTIYSTASASNLYPLADGTITNEKGTYTYKQYIDAPTNARVEYTIDSNQLDDPALYLHFPEDSSIYHYRLSFPTAIKSDIDSNKDFDDLDGKKIRMLNRNFTIVDTDNTTGLIKMFRDAKEDILEEGQTKTYSIDGKTYEVTAITISNVAPFMVKFIINGEMTDALEVGEYYMLQDRAEIFVKEILPNEAGDVISDVVTFFIGPESIKFLDRNYSGRNNGGTLEVGGEKVPDVNVDIVASLDGNIISISKIEVNFIARNNYFVPIGGKLSDSLDQDEKDNLFLRSIDYEFGGMYFVGSPKSCTLILVNSTSDWHNMTSCTNKILTQQREITKYDYNNCGTLENETSIEQREVECEEVLIEINKPKSGIYNTSKIYFNIITSDIVKSIKYCDLDDTSPRNVTLCSRSCLGYGNVQARYKVFPDGNHSIAIYVTKNDDSVYEETINFFIDGKNPRIISTNPIRGYTNGMFTVRYNEENCQNLSFEISSPTHSADKGEPCESGKNIVKTIGHRTPSFEGEIVNYTIRIIDIAGNTDSKTVKDLIFDTTAPQFNTIIWNVNGNYLYLNISIDETAKYLKYIDYEANRTATLCSNCDEFGSSQIKRRYFGRGSHNISIIAEDYAGNKGTRQDIIFTI